MKSRVEAVRYAAERGWLIEAQLRAPFAIRAVAADSKPSVGVGARRGLGNLSSHLKTSIKVECLSS
jgi:hypothetical protein